MQVEPKTCQVPGNGFVALRIRITGTKVGMLRRVLRLASEPFGRSLHVPIELFAVGQTVVIGTRCLNFGLLPLGESKVENLVIENHSELPARWMLVPIK